MQFNISINQKAFTEIAPNCDIIDAAIFDFIHNFIGSGETDRIEDEGDWYWVSYQKIIDENPILGIKTKAPIYKRIDKLVEAGILKRYHKNQELAKTYFARGKYYKDILYNKPRSEKTDPTSEKNDPSVSKDRPPTSEKIDNHSTNNHSTNHKAPPSSDKIPTLQEVKAYFKENGYDPKVGVKAFNYYQTSVEGTQRQYWRDSKGNKIRNWKMKMQAVWFRDENEIKSQSTTPMQLI